MLTCNSECEEEDAENYGRTLHRKSSFKNNFYPKNFTNKNREERARTSKKIRNTLPSLAVSKMQSRHTLKSGNTVLFNGKKLQVVKKDGKWYSDGQELNRKLVTYVPDIEEGTSVMYKQDLWTVEESDGAHLSIRNVKSRAEERVEARDVVALEY
jgi:ASC-1-like (ASCH) protein